MRYIRNLFIGGLFALAQLSVTVYMPSMPRLAVDFDVTSAAIFLTVSAYYIGYALGQLFWGTLSDYQGRKKTMLLALFLFTITSLLMIYITHYFIFIAAIAILGFLAAAYTSIGNALLKDLYPTTIKHAIGYIGIIMAIAPTIAPVIGSHLLNWQGWQSTYIFLAIYALIAFIGIYFLVHEKNLPRITRHKKKDSLMNIVSILLSLTRNWQFLRSILTLALTFSVLVAYFAAAPFIFIDHLHYSATQFGYIGFATSSFYVLGTVYNVYFGKYKSSERIISLGTIITSFSMLLFLIAAIFNIHHLLSLILIISSFMFGQGILLPAAKGAAMNVFKHHVGKAASLMKFTQTSTAVIITMIAAHLHSEKTLLPICVLLFSMCILSMLCFFCIGKRIEEPQ